jgi:hypothetical protein
VKKKLTHLILAFALVFNAVMPAYAAISIVSHNLEQAEFAEFYGEEAKLLICTSDGFKYVSIADIKSGKVGVANKLHCKLCLASIGQDKVQNADIAILDLRAHSVASEELLLLDSTSFSQTSKAQNHSRAPPQNS